VVMNSDGSNQVMTAIPGVPLCFSKDGTRLYMDNGKSYADVGPDNTLSMKVQNPGVDLGLGSMCQLEGDLFVFFSSNNVGTASIQRLVEPGFEEVATFSMGSIERSWHAEVDDIEFFRECISLDGSTIAYPATDSTGYRVIRLSNGTSLLRGMDYYGWPVWIDWP
jgi:hypothetical protein